MAYLLTIQNQRSKYQRAVVDPRSRYEIYCALYGTPIVDKQSVAERLADRPLLEGSKSLVTADFYAVELCHRTWDQLVGPENWRTGDTEESVVKRFNDTQLEFA